MAEADLGSDRFEMSDSAYLASFDAIPFFSRATAQANVLMLENPASLPLKVFLNAYTAGQSTYHSLRITCIVPMTVGTVLEGRDAPYGPFSEVCNGYQRRRHFLQNVYRFFYDLEKASHHPNLFDTMQLIQLIATVPMQASVATAGLIFGTGLPRGHL